MEQIYIDRLERLYALALRIAANDEWRKRFNLNSWVLDAEGDDLERDAPELVRKDDGCVVLKEGACGTAACMIGWAAQEPEFNAEGFCLVTETQWGREITPNPYWHETDAIGWDAVEQFFGIDNDTAQDLFSSGHYRGREATPLDVAARIRNVIDNGGRYVEA